MAESGSSVYDYSPAQAVMSRLYDLRLEALISRRYHGLKLDQTSRRIAFAEIIAALSSSAAVASLAAMGWGLECGCMALSLWPPLVHRFTARRSG